MKLGTLVALSLCSAALAVAQAPIRASEAWVGIWHANVDGQPTSTLTLATDTGELGGTVVLDMVSAESGTPRVIASEPHTLLNPHLSGNTLTFEVKMKRPDGQLMTPAFTIVLTSPAKATLHCMNCGPEAPIVELTKEL